MPEITVLKNNHRRTELNKKQQMAPFPKTSLKSCVMIRSVETLCTDFVGAPGYTTIYT